MDTATAMALMTLVAGGCLSSSLSIGYPPSTISRDPLARVEPQRVEVQNLVDRRPETDKIGYIVGGFSNRAGAYRTDRPVPEIVKEALKAVLRANGHRTEGGRDVVISGEVRKFWFDQTWIIGSWVPYPTPAAFDFSANVEILLDVADGQTGALLVRRTYHGRYLERVRDRSDATVKRVVNEALVRAVHEFSGDPDVAEAFKRRPR